MPSIPGVDNQKVKRRAFCVDEEGHGITRADPQVQALCKVVNASIRGDPECGIGDIGNHAVRPVLV